MPSASALYSIKERIWHEVLKHPHFVSGYRHEMLRWRRGYRNYADQKRIPADIREVSISVLMSPPKRVFGGVFIEESAHEGRGHGIHSDGKRLCGCGVYVLRCAALLDEVIGGYRPTMVRAYWRMVGASSRVERMASR